MATVNFYLKNPKDIHNESLIYLFFSYDKKRLKYSTGEKVLPSGWLTSRQRLKKSYTGSFEVNGYLDELQSTTLKVYREFVTDKVSPTPEQLRQALNDAFQKKQNDPDNFFSILDQFIEQSATRLTERTLQRYRTTGNHLQAFQSKTGYQINFESLDMVFYDKFLTYCMKDKNMLDNTVGKYIAVLKSFLNWASERGYNQTYHYKRFKALRQDIDIIYLTEEELMLLYSLNLSYSPKLERIRDVFVFGCFTGLRFSDIHALIPQNVDGNRLVITTQKTRDSLIVPLSKYAQAILTKYHNSNSFLSVPSNQKMNAYLKELGEHAGLSEPVTLTKFRGRERIEETKPKYMFLSSHTARRTFVTLSLEKGMRPEVVMKITGHTSYSTMKKYLKITSKITELEMNKVWV